jgi:hypothetical protein
MYDYDGPLFPQPPPPRQPPPSARGQQQQGADQDEDPERRAFNEELARMAAELEKVSGDGIAVRGSIQGGKQGVLGMQDKARHVEEGCKQALGAR